MQYLHALQSQLHSSFWHMSHFGPRVCDFLAPILIFTAIPLRGHPHQTNGTQTNLRVPPPNCGYSNHTEGTPTTLRVPPTKLRVTPQNLWLSQQNRGYPSQTKGYSSQTKDTSTRTRVLLNKNKDTPTQLRVPPPDQEFPYQIGGNPTKQTITKV